MFSEFYDLYRKDRTPIEEAYYQDWLKNVDNNRDERINKNNIHNRILIIKVKQTNLVDLEEVEVQIWNDYITKMEEIKLQTINFDEIFLSENPLKKFKEIEETIFVDNIAEVYYYAIKNSNFEVYEYIITNYHNDILNFNSFYEFLKGGIWIHRSVENCFSSVKILEDMLKNIPIFVFNAILSIFDKNFREGNCDIVSFILDNFDVSKYENFVKKREIFSKDIDCFNLIINKQPNFFSLYRDYSITCDFNIAEHLIFYGFGVKINPLSFIGSSFLQANDNIEFITRHKDEMKISGYQFRNFYSYGDFLRYLRLIKIVPENVDFEDLMERAVKSYRGLAGFDFILPGVIREIEQIRREL